MKQYGKVLSVLNVRGLLYFCCLWVVFLVCVTCYNKTFLNFERFVLSIKTMCVCIYVFIYIYIFVVLYKSLHRVL